MPFFHYPSMVGKFEPTLPVGRAVISPVRKKKKKKKKNLECQWQKQMSPSSIISISFHSVDSVRKLCSQKENTRDRRIQPSKATIQNCFYGTYTVPTI